jgi:monofunctional biosynthetic peptidoglycan transglycosylase
MKRARKAITLGNFMFLMSLLILGGSGFMVYSGYRFLNEEFPDVSLLNKRFPVVRYQGRDLPPKITFQRVEPAGWTRINDISKVAVGAIIVSEDWAFYQHRGYDAEQIKESIKEDWKAGRFRRGASTITQQVVRNLFLDKDKTLWRKLKELVLAVRLESETGKRRILETYFNIAEWGEGIYGIGAASNHYFGKTPSQLTAKEGAFLAMLLPSPKKYSQSFRSRRLTDFAKDTVQSILDKMEQAHYITEEERDRAAIIPLSFELPPEGAM